jgi:putative oxidoreductase
MEGVIDKKRLIWPGLVGLYESIAPYSYAIIRFCVGGVVMFHGYPKLFGTFAAPVAQNVLTPLGFPMPLAWAYFLGLLEFFGGAALALGFLTRPIALMLAVELAIVTYWHGGNGFFFSAQRGGYEYPLLLTIIYAAIFFRGSGRCSIDRLIGKEF